MHFFKNFYFKTIKYNLINKFVYKQGKKLPELKKVVLSFSSKAVNLKKLFSSLLALEIISNQKGILTTSKISIISIKINKGNPVGCKLTLQKHNLFKVFADIIFKALPKLKSANRFSFNQGIKKNVTSLKIYNIFCFSALEKHYYFFNNLPKLNITILTTSTSNKELIFLCKLFQLPR